MSAGHGSVAAARTADAIRARVGGEVPSVAIILGSGLGGLADRLQHRTVVSYADIPGFPPATVAGHSGSLVAGSLAGRRVVAMSGRFHMYEGHAAALAGFPARVLHALGATTLIVTNAAGGIRRTFAAGDIMLIRDHVNLAFRNPLTGGVEAGDDRFPDMSSPYDARLQDLARDAARKAGVTLQEGVYGWLLGPSYETPAEITMLGVLGVDAVGMSTVPEVIVARARGLPVLGLSCITNAASGISESPITHTDVLDASRAAGERMADLVTGVVDRLSR